MGAATTLHDDHKTNTGAFRDAGFETGRLELFARHGLAGESHRVKDRDGRMTYAIVRHGDVSPPTVLVHGGLSQAGEWALVAGRLPGHVVIPDRPGCGLSYRIDYHDVADYQQAAADWLLDLADGIGAGQLDLVGSSMGGYFSIAFALAHPDRVRRLALVGAPAGIDRRLPRFVRLWGNPLAGRVIARMRITDPEQLRMRVFAPLLVTRAEAVPLDLLETACAASALPGADRAAHSMLRTVTTLRGWRPELSLRDEMTGLEVPTLFAWGDADAFAPPSSGLELAPRMPDARVEVIPDAGHLPHVDQPDVVARALTGFFGAAD